MAGFRLGEGPQKTRRVREFDLSGTLRISEGCIDTLGNKLKPYFSVKFMSVANCAVCCAGLRVE